MIKKTLLMAPLCVGLLTFNAVSMDNNYEIEFATDMAGPILPTTAKAYVGATPHETWNTVDLPINKGHQVTPLVVKQRPGSVRIYFEGVTEYAPKSGWWKDCPVPNGAHSTKYILDSEDADFEKWTCDYAGG